MGITQNTYDKYRIRKNLPKNNVKNLTKEEAKKIYYEDYWLKAVKPEMSKKMALAAFDGEVNLGNPVNSRLVKKSNGNLDKYLELRLDNYSTDKNRASFGKGWSNRINKLKNRLDSLDYDNYFNINPIKRVTDNNLLKQLQKDNDEKLQRYQDMLYESMLKSSSKNTTSKDTPKITGKTLKNMLDNQYQKLKDFTNKIYMESDAIDKRFSGEIPKDYKNPHLENDRIFTKEEIEKMSRSEYQKNEKAIRYQRKTIGIPTKSQAQKTAAKKGSGMVHVSGYTTGDGRKVEDYYRSYPRG